MAHLTESAHYSRVIIKWGFIGLVALMVGRMVISGAISWYKQAHPVIPPATIGFGILPAVAFPAQEPIAVTYTLETVTGKLPSFPTQAEVILETPQRQSLLAMERASKEVAVLGFKGSPEKISDVSYRWRQSSPIASALTMMIYDGRFVWETDWSANPNFLTEKSLPSREEAIKSALEYFRKVDNEATDITEENAQITYLKGLAGVFQPVTSLLEADFIQVDLFRSPLEDRPFVTSTPTQAPFRVILSGNSRLGRVVRLDYNYFSLDYTESETYPLRPITQAWKELSEGKGYIASLDNGVTEVVVRKVELAYYDSFEPQSYVQPVYKFSGDGNFVGYIQAVKDPTPRQ